MKYISLLIVSILLTMTILGHHPLASASGNWHLIFLICVGSATWHICQEKIIAYSCRTANTNPEYRSGCITFCISIICATIFSIVSVIFTELCVQKWYTIAEEKKISVIDMTGISYVIFFVFLLAVFIGPIKYITERRGGEFLIKKMPGLLKILFQIFRNG